MKFIFADTFRITTKGMLKPVSCKFNNCDETERFGFIAQDIEQALPASLYDTIERSEPEHGLALIERQNDTDRTYRASDGELLAPLVKKIVTLSALSPAPDRAAHRRAA
jgi:hypothetical protein